MLIRFPVTIQRAVTEPKHIQVTIDGVSVNTVDQTGNALYTVSGTTLTFTNAPANGSAITFKRKKTTFGVNDGVTFDAPNPGVSIITADSNEIRADEGNFDTTCVPTVETTFDNKGTTFSSQPITFDQVRPENTQLAFSRENVMDGINNTSKHRS